MDMNIVYERLTDLTLESGRIQGFGNSGKDISDSVCVYSYLVLPPE